MISRFSYVSYPRQLDVFMMMMSYFSPFILDEIFYLLKDFSRREYKFSNFICWMNYFAVSIFIPANRTIHYQFICQRSFGM